MMGEEECRSSSFCGQHSGMDARVIAAEADIVDCKENEGKQWEAINEKVDGKNFRWLMGMVFFAMVGMGTAQIATYHKVSKMEIRLEERAKIDTVILKHLSEDKILRPEDVKR